MDTLIGTQGDPNYCSDITPERLWVPFEMPRIPYARNMLKIPTCQGYASDSNARDTLVGHLQGNCPTCSAIALAQ